MGDHFSAPVKVRSERATRGILALLLVVGVLAAITITGSGIAGAADLSFGGYSPYVAHGGADVNYDGVVNGVDDSTGFFDGTDLIDGHLDCDSWGATLNDGSSGDGGIDGSDDCILQGYFTDDVETFIHVVDGFFAYTSTTETGVKTPISDAGWKLPWAYDSGTTFDLTSTDYTMADWAWVIEAGFVDYDHDGYEGETAGNDDASDFLPLGIDIDDGYVDVDDDGNVNDSGDDCTDECFFGLDVNNGKVQSGTVVNPFTANAGPTGPAGPAGVSGRVAIAASSSTNSLNKSKSATCSGTTKVLGGGYSLTGDTATLAHLTVVANGPAGGTAWRVRVIEATPTSGTWAVTVTAICATA